MNEIIKKIPILRSIVRFFKKNSQPFTTSKQYWINRYEKGGNSGPGSYNKLAIYKADIINNFVLRENIKSTIEFGSGDGNQTTYFNFPNYIGFDISQKAIDLCKTKFKNDSEKEFYTLGNYNDQIAELTLSLDVVYHLIEDQIFEDYMHRLFKSATRYVIIYSSNDDSLNENNNYDHVKHRNFTSWIENNVLDWKLVKVIQNSHNFDGDAQVGSHSNFYIYKKYEE